MQVSKWGNSLAVRIPSAVVEALKLKEGDEVDIRVSGDRTFALSRDTTKDKAMARIRAFRKTLPDGWTFDRSEANAR